jgi:hypothetical protein
MIPNIPAFQYSSIPNRLRILTGYLLELSLNPPIFLDTLDKRTHFNNKQPKDGQKRALKNFLTYLSIHDRILEISIEV